MTKQEQQEQQYAERDLRILDATLALLIADMTVAAEKDLAVDAAYKDRNLTWAAVQLLDSYLRYVRNIWGSFKTLREDAKVLLAREPSMFHYYTCKAQQLGDTLLERMPELRRYADRAIEAALACKKIEVAVVTKEVTAVTKEVTAVPATTASILPSCSKPLPKSSSCCCS
jgi:hypothetical protein